MKIYIHEGKGHFIGSKAIVLAKSRKTAEALIRQELDSSGLKKEVLNIRENEILPGLIYFDNGDY